MNASVGPKPLHTVQFEGFVPKSFVFQGIARIERVRGATAIVAGHNRYLIEREVIARPDREIDRQFLVVEIGERLSFESESDEVFIAGTLVSDRDGGTVPARDCIFIPRDAS